MDDAVNEMNRIGGQILYGFAGFRQKGTPTAISR